MGDRSLLRSVSYVDDARLLESSTCNIPKCASCFLQELPSICQSSIVTSVASPTISNNRPDSGFASLTGRIHSSNQNKHSPSLTKPHPADTHPSDKGPILCTLPCVNAIDEELSDSMFVGSFFDLKGGYEFSRAQNVSPSFQPVEANSDDSRISDISSPALLHASIESNQDSSEGLHCPIPRRHAPASFTDDLDGLGSLRRSVVMDNCVDHESEAADGDDEGEGTLTKPVKSFRHRVPRRCRSRQSPTLEMDTQRLQPDMAHRRRRKRGQSAIDVAYTSIWSGRPMPLPVPAPMPDVVPQQPQQQQLRCASVPLEPPSFTARGLSVLAQRMAHIGDEMAAGRHGRHSLPSEDYFRTPLASSNSLWRLSSSLVSLVTTPLDCMHRIFTELTSMNFSRNSSIRLQRRHRAETYGGHSSVRRILPTGDIHPRPLSIASSAHCTEHEEVFHLD